MSRTSQNLSSGESVGSNTDPATGEDNVADRRREEADKENAPPKDKAANSSRPKGVDAPSDGEEENTLRKEIVSNSARPEGAAPARGGDTDSAPPKNKAADSTRFLGADQRPSCRDEGDVPPKAKFADPTRPKGVDSASGKV